MGSPSQIMYSFLAAAPQINRYLQPCSKHPSDPMGKKELYTVKKISLVDVGRMAYSPEWLPFCSSPLKGSSCGRRL